MKTLVSYLYLVCNFVMHCEISELFGTNDHEDRGAILLKALGGGILVLWTHF